MDKGIEAIREAVRRAPLTWPEGLSPEWQAYFDAVTPLHVAELIAALERNGQLKAERDALRESGLNGQANTRAAADIYFQLIEECEIQPGGSLVQHIDGMRDRIAELESRSLCVKLPDYRNSPDMHTKQYYEAIGFNQGLDACAEVIRAAGGTVEGSE